MSHRTWAKLACALAGALCLLGGALADDRKSAPELIRSRGFNVDEFDVISQNYVLKVYRIINPLADPNRLHPVPVVAAHGVAFDVSNMMASSTNSRPRKPIPDRRLTLYEMQNGTEDRCLYFYLSNNNYDVWFIEARATNERNSRQLRDRNPNGKGFWDFAIDEQALIDLPTQIEFVLQRTKAPKIAYVAYSQSSTLMFALLSMRPKFSQRLACFIAMAPVVFTTHLKGPIWPLAKQWLKFKPSVAVEGLPEWVRRAQNFAFTYMCSVSFIRDTLCKRFWEIISGKEKKGVLLEGGMVEDMLKSTSLKSFEQYLVNSDRGDFRMYDYHDDLRNKEEYGQPFAPEYNVSNINLRTIILFRSVEDFLSTAQDQLVLISRLKVPLYADHILEDYSHIDFFISPTVVRDINEPILRHLDQITGRRVVGELHSLRPEQFNSTTQAPAKGSSMAGSSSVSSASPASSSTTSPSPSSSSTVSPSPSSSSSSSAASASSTGSWSPSSSASSASSTGSSSPSSSSSSSASSSSSSSMPSSPPSGRR